MTGLVFVTEAYESSHMPVVVLFLLIHLFVIQRMWKISEFVIRIDLSVMTYVSSGT